MASNAPQSEEDCTCPVCCDIFKDPVVLLCGHSFCKICLQEWWRQSRLQTCPVCKELFPMPQPPRNLALRNLSDNLRREKSQTAASGSKELCSLHSEKLKLFCRVDQERICVICRDAKKHKNHDCAPINEAADDYRAQLTVNLTTLKSKLGSFQKEKLKCDKMASHIKFQAQQTEKAIKEEFQKLYQFLRAEEARRIDALRKEEGLKSEAMNMRIVNWSTEISSLKDKIKTIEKEMKAEDISFMQNVKATIKRSQCQFPEPVTPSGALIDEAKHRGNLLYSVWKKIKDIIQYTPVTLDPNTAWCWLIVSEQLTCSTRSDKMQPFPENPERMGSFEILGYEGISSGKHVWDVEVGGYWTVGVAYKRDDRTAWGIYKCVCTDVLRELTPVSDVEMVSEDLLPQKVRVQLDYDHRKLSFFDLGRKMCVYTMKCQFTEAVFPCFKGNIKILPAELSVQVRLPGEILCKVQRPNNTRRL